MLGNGYIPILDESCNADGRGRVRNSRDTGDIQPHLPRKPQFTIPRTVFVADYSYRGMLNENIPQASEGYAARQQPQQQQEVFQMCATLLACMSSPMPGTVRHGRVEQLARGDGSVATLPGALVSVSTDHRGIWEREADLEATI